MAKNLIEKFIKVEWIIEEKKFYKSIFENFDSNILSENSIVNEEYREEDFLQSQYLVDTFTNKLNMELKNLKMMRIWNT